MIFSYVNDKSNEIDSVHTAIKIKMRKSRTRTVKTKKKKSNRNDCVCGICFKYVFIPNVGITKDFGHVIVSM